MKDKQFLLECMLRTYCEIWPAISSNQLEPQLVEKLKLAIFNFGHTHSAKGTSIFYDNYLRDGSIIFEVPQNKIDPGPSLLLNSIRGLNIRLKSSPNILYIPILDPSCANILVKPLLSKLTQIFKININQFRLVQSSIKFADKTIHCLQIHKQRNDNTQELHDDYILVGIIDIIGRFGALPTRENLLWIFANMAWNSCCNADYKQDIYLQSILNKFKDISPERVQQYLNTNAKTDPNINTLSLEKIIDEIHTISSQKICIKQRGLINPDIYEFYISLFNNLFNSSNINNSNLKYLPTQHKEQLILSLLRIKFKVEFAMQNTNLFDSFMLGIELAIDEITLIGAITPFKFNATQIKNALTRHVTQSMMPLGTLRPSGIQLTGSCVNAIYSQALAAVNYLIKNKKDKVNIFLSANTYFEIVDSLSMPRDYKNHACLSISKSGDKLASIYENGWLDIILLSPNYNVNSLVPGYEHTNMIEMINDQLSLRENLNTQDQLIVIIDSTMNALNDQRLIDLFATFTNEVLNGQVAFMLSHSLNKYCQLGLDRTAAALSMQVFEPSKFQGLNTEERLFKGFDVNDFTVQMLTQEICFAQYHMHSYYKIIHNNSKAIYINLLPTELITKDSLISIDNPFSKDEYGNCWAFVNIRFHNFFARLNSEPIRIMLKKIICGYLNTLDITARDGFGFSKTTHVKITGTEDNPSIRISVGPEANSDIFSRLFSLIINANHILSEYLQNPTSIEALKEALMANASNANEMLYNTQHSSRTKNRIF